MAQDCIQPASLLGWAAATASSQLSCCHSSCASRGLAWPLSLHGAAQGPRHLGGEAAGEGLAGGWGPCSPALFPPHTLLCAPHLPGPEAKGPGVTGEEGLQLGCPGGGKIIKGPQRATQGGLVWGTASPKLRVPSHVSRKGWPRTCGQEACTVWLGWGHCGSISSSGLCPATGGTGRSRLQPEASGPPALPAAVTSPKTEATLPRAGGAGGPSCEGGRG